MYQSTYLESNTTWYTRFQLCIESTAAVECPTRSASHSALSIIELKAIKTTIKVNPLNSALSLQIDSTDSHRENLECLAQVRVSDVLVPARRVNNPSKFHLHCPALYRSDHLRCSLPSLASFGLVFSRYTSSCHVQSIQNLQPNTFSPDASKSSGRRYRPT